MSCAQTAKDFLSLRAFVLSIRFSDASSNKYKTYGIRRKSTNIKSEVIVSRVVMSALVLFFAPFETLLSQRMPHSTESSTSTGDFPSLGETFISFSERRYFGSSLAAAKTSNPKGDLRFKS